MVVGAGGGSGGSTFAHTHTHTHTNTHTHIHTHNTHTHASTTHVLSCWQAALIDPSKDAYDVLLDDYEKGMTGARMDEIFEEVGISFHCHRAFA